MNFCCVTLQTLSLFFCLLVFLFYLLVFSDSLNFFHTLFLLNFAPMDIMSLLLVIALRYNENDPADIHVYLEDEDRGSMCIYRRLSLFFSVC